MSEEKLKEDPTGGKLDCKLLQQSKRQRFQSFAFNAQSTILFVGCQGKIKIYGFNIFQKLILILQGQSDEAIDQICFMKKSNSLIGINNDGSFIIFERYKNVLWKLSLRLQAHTDEITCISNNENEDLLITGSLDKKIKIWRKENFIWYCQQSIKTSSTILSLCLNSSETKIISCGHKNIILIIEQKPSQEWIIIQQIQVDEISKPIKPGKLFFISENKFLISSQQAIEIYEQNEYQLKLVQELKFKGCPKCFSDQQQFIEKENILIVKQDCFANVFRKIQDQSYVFQKRIKFNCGSLLSRLAINEKFLITWNCFQTAISLENQNIQIDFIKNITQK